MVFEAIEDLDGLLDGRLLDHDRLETTGSAESFSTCLRYSSVVVAPITWISPRDSGGLRMAAASMEPSALPAPMRVCIVDEQDDVAVVLYLLDDALETVLELAAILRASDECGDVERHEALVTQHVGHLTICDELGKPLGDGGLAHAGLADKQGLFFVRREENLLDAVDFAFAPDDRVERVLGRELGEIVAELLERRSPGWGARPAAARPSGA